MSRYDDDYEYERPRRRRGTRTRAPEYIATEETYIQKGPGTRDLVLRSREDDYDDSRALDYRRDSYREDYDRPRRARSHGFRDRDSYYGDDYTDYSRSRRRRRSYEDDHSYYSDDYDRPRERRKSRVGEVLDDLGLGGVAAAVMGKSSRSRSRRRRGRHDNDSYYDRSVSRSRSRENLKKWQQAAKAAVISGVIEAVRSRNEPGGWAGSKGTRVATAALGAAGIDGLIDRDPDHRSKRHIVESVVGGLAANRLANGPRERSQSQSRGRSRSRSQSRSQSVVGRLRSASRSVFRGRSSSRGARESGSGSTLKDVAALGGVAAVGKAIYDRVRSKSRGRLGRSRSASSDDSYVPSRQQRYGQRNRGGPDREYGPTREQTQRGRQAESRTGEDGGTARDRGRSNSESSISTTDLENRRKKSRGKELLTAGLATVATIHAAHGVYNSMVASEKRHKMVMEGEMSPEEARKRKSKNMLQDAAAVGIAALGIKSAYSEWKEMNESRKEKHEIEARHRRHKKMREKRERERQMGFGQQGGGGGFGPQGYATGGALAYGDSNPYQPYAVQQQQQTYPGNFPPPPGGGPPR